MNSTEMVFNLRKRIFTEWRYKRYAWEEVHEKYGFSKAWFYKWLKRYLKYGENGLCDKPRSKPLQPLALSPEQKESILDHLPPAFAKLKQSLDPVLGFNPFLFYRTFALFFLCHGAIAYQTTKK